VIPRGEGGPRRVSARERNLGTCSNRSESLLRRLAGSSPWVSRLSSRPFTRRTCATQLTPSLVSGQIGSWEARPAWTIPTGGDWTSPFSPWRLMSTASPRLGTGTGHPAACPWYRRRRHRRWRESFPRDRVGARPWTAIARRTRPHGSTAGPTGLRSPSAVCGPRPSGQIRLLGDAARPSSSGRCNRTHWHTGAPCASAPPRALTIPVSTRSGSAGSPGWSSTAARWPRT